MFVGLGLVVWPSVIDHTNEFVNPYGARFSLLAGVGAMALLGIRYPLQMLPLILFEFVWKTIFLAAFVFPLWSVGKMDEVTIASAWECATIYIFIPLIPWRYVFTHYVRKRGERWRRSAVVTVQTRKQVLKKTAILLRCG